MIEIRPIDREFSRWRDLLDLIQSSFGYMADVIDPPSSALLLTVDSLRKKALEEQAFVATDGTVLAGCVFCRPEPPDCLYIGKLAVHPPAQGKGVGRSLLTAAENAARSAGFTQLRLETRIELIGNHQTFEAWGFRKTAESRHKGYDRTTSIEMCKTLK